MINLKVLIEVNGKSVTVGSINGNDSTDARFSYDSTYLQQTDSKPISISLPLTNKEYSTERTQAFFDGLLPEGFTRKCIAEMSHADETDYLSLLSLLGNECLGAIKILDTISEEQKPDYRELSLSDIQALAEEGSSQSADIVTKSHLSLTGASGKVGLYYNQSDNIWYIPIGDAPSTHIVKQSHIRLKRIVANEQLCLLTAKRLGIDVPESIIIQVENNDDENVLFASKRYDRKISEKSRRINGMPVPFRLHQEDFSQAMVIPSINKYEKNGDGYLKSMFDILKTCSADPITDQLKLWDICIFNYLIGNTDNHIKNISLLYSEDLEKIRLAPAYDIVSTMIYESSSENMALSIAGKYDINEIKKEDFIKEARICGLGEKLAMNHFDIMVNAFVKELYEAANSLFAQKFTDIYSICERILEKGGIKHYIK